MYIITGLDMLRVYVCGDLCDNGGIIGRVTMEKKKKFCLGREVGRREWWVFSCEPPLHFMSHFMFEEGRSNLESPHYIPSRPNLLGFSCKDLYSIVCTTLLTTSELG